MFSFNIPRNSLIILLLFDYYKIGSFKNRIPLFYVNRSYRTVFICIDIVFHLHGFEDNDSLTSLDSIAHFDFHVKNNSGQRRFYTALLSASGSRSCLSSRSGSRRTCRSGSRFCNWFHHRSSSFDGFFHFNLIWHSVHFNLSDIIHYIRNNDSIRITVYFIFIFFHCVFYFIWV